MPPSGEYGLQYVEVMAFWMSRWLFCRYLQEFRYGYSYRPRALALALLLASGLATANEALVIQTDFGLKDGAVSAMKGSPSGWTAPCRSMT